MPRSLRAGRRHEERPARQHHEHDRSTRAAQLPATIPRRFRGQQRDDVSDPATRAAQGRLRQDRAIPRRRSRGRGATRSRARGHVGLRDHVLRRDGTRRARGELAAGVARRPRGAVTTSGRANGASASIIGSMALSAITPKTIGSPDSCVSRRYAASARAPEGLCAPSTITARSPTVTRWSRPGQWASARPVTIAPGSTGCPPPRGLERHDRHGRVVDLVRATQAQRHRAVRRSRGLEPGLSPSVARRPRLTAHSRGAWCSGASRRRAVCSTISSASPAATRRRPARRA